VLLLHVDANSTQLLNILDLNSVRTCHYCNFHFHNS